jgi:hypothetical protein
VLVAMAEKHAPPRFQYLEREKPER